MRHAGFVGRVYWHCDPPTVFLDAPEGATLRINGSVVMLESELRGPVGQQQLVRYRRLEPAEGCSLQRLQLLIDDATVEEKLVRFTSETAPVAAGNFRMDWTCE